MPEEQKKQNAGCQMLEVTGSGGWSSQFVASDFFLKTRESRRIGV
jgi:hypothetical protein